MHAEKTYTFAARVSVAALLLTCAGCTRTITRVEVQEVRIPVATPCPADLPPRPAKPAATLPDDARNGLAMVMRHLLAVDVWADAAEGAVAACNQKPVE